MDECGKLIALSCPTDWANEALGRLEPVTCKRARDHFGECLPMSLEEQLQMKTSAREYLAGDRFKRRRAHDCPTCACEGATNV